VDIAKEHCRFFRAKLLFTFTVLPFGIIVYLDDVLCAMDGDAHALQAS
jgi:hypothetical protein